MFTFKYFTGAVTGWWLVINPGQTKVLAAVHEQFGNGFAYSAGLDRGETVLVNASGGYHTITEAHKVAKVVRKNELQWPVEVPKPDRRFSNTKSTTVKAKLTTADDAKAAGYAKFNNGPHLCVDIPAGPATITAKLADGRKITFAFACYREGGNAQCVDIQYHSSGTTNDNNVPTFNVDVRGQGPLFYSSHKAKDAPTLVVVPLTHIPQDFDGFLSKILDGGYQSEAEFRNEVLVRWPDTKNAALFDEIASEHSDLTGEAKMEEILGDFIKVCAS